MMNVVHLPPRASFANPFDTKIERCDIDNKKQLVEMIRKNRFTAHFQPIVSAESDDIFAYEGLCRTLDPNPFATLDNLFEQARMCGEISALDLLCRHNSIRQAAGLNITSRDARLFINICPTSLQQSDHSPGATEKMVKAFGLEKEKVILEITEQEAVSNYPLFLKAIKHYRDRGFKIAIDDFGAGYGGMKMLSLVVPDYVKIDRHFFRDIDSAHINYSLIDAIATICHRLGIDVIGEGIESEKDVRVCREFGIHLMQGYYYAKPAETLLTRDEINCPIGVSFEYLQSSFEEAICIGDIVQYTQPVRPGDRILDILGRFSSNPLLFCLPVVKGDIATGIINRHRFMETQMVGRFGYGMNLNYYKKVEELCNGRFLQVPFSMPLEDVATKINARRDLTLYDDVCVTRSGKYVGTVAVGALLNAVAGKAMRYARGANPLTGLPGNEFIQREISKLLSQSVHFDICYIDIDNFKPYNDKHGFALGDQVIKEIGRLVAEAAKQFKQNGIGFGGHIGGDDFILILRPRQSVVASQWLIDRLSQALPRFHSRESLRSGSYISEDRQGKPRDFPLLSLSVGIVSTEVHHITSVAQASSMASDLKKRAKAIEGSSIVRDRRMKSWFEEQCHLG